MSPILKWLVIGAAVLLAGFVILETINPEGLADRNVPGATTGTGKTKAADGK
jgi:hypothetical protein